MEIQGFLLITLHTISVIHNGVVLFLKQLSSLPCACYSHATPATNTKLLHSNAWCTLEHQNG